jgi:hypothetical protein
LSILKKTGRGGFLMKKLATLVAGLLLVGAVASAADYSATTQVNFKNDAGNDAHEIEWEVVSGYMALGDNLTFTFDIDKYFYELSDAESFDNELGLSYKLPSTEMMGKVFSNEVSLKYEVEDIATEGADGEDSDTTKLVYVTSTDVAGVATSVELIGGVTEDKDNYEANLYLGKGFGPVSASVEYLNAFHPDASGDDETNTELNVYLNYNYDLGMGFAFNTEVGYEAGKFEIGNAGPAELYVAPQIRYTYAINDETSFFTGAVYEVISMKSDDAIEGTYSDKDGDGKVYLGFSYSK